MPVSLNSKMISYNIYIFNPENSIKCPNSVYSKLETRTRIARCKLKIASPDVWSSPNGVIMSDGLCFDFSTFKWLLIVPSPSVFLPFTHHSLLLQMVLCVVKRVKMWSLAWKCVQWRRVRSQRRCTVDPKQSALWVICSLAPPTGSKSVHPTVPG